MALFKLLLDGFTFPTDLPAKNSNFRFVFQLRHFDATSETWLTTESVSPGLSTYWECDEAEAEGNRSGAKYVRDGSRPQFKPLAPWDQVIVLVNSSELFQMRVVVYDVNRTDWLDQLRSLGGAAIGALVGAAKNLPIPLASQVGTLLDKVKEAVIDKLAKEDTVLFAVTYEFGQSQGSQRIDLSHEGYKMTLQLVTTGDPAPGRRAMARGAGEQFSSGRIHSESAFAHVPGRNTSRAARQPTSPRVRPRNRR